MTKFVYNVIQPQGDKMQTLELLAVSNNGLAARTLADAWVDGLTASATAVIGTIIVDSESGNISYKRERTKFD